MTPILRCTNAVAKVWICFQMANADIRITFEMSFCSGHFAF